MSNIEPRCRVSVSTDCAAAAAQPVYQPIPTREATLGAGMMIRRALPSRHRRLIGAWCFLDHFGPVDVGRGEGLRIGPHPHIGLQTFTWPIQGEILHRDSLGCEQLIRPGQVNLMTAGRGIAHSEESPAERSPTLHGAQLWIALPEAHRHDDPAFEHYPELPVVNRDGCAVTVLAGEALGVQSPVRVYSPLLGLDIATTDRAATTLPLRSDYEYGVLVLAGEVRLEGEPLGIGTLIYLGCGRTSLALEAETAARLLVLGGEPFAEEVLLWWNLVARTQAEITEATEDWKAHRRFGEVRGYRGERLEAPALPWKS